MANMMQYYTPEGKITVAHCPGCSTFYAPKPFDPGEPIPRFYSERHAMEAGWRITSNRKFCSPDKKSVWICPKCAGTGE